MKIRVHELAKRYNMGSKEFLTLLQEKVKVSVSSNLSGLAEEDVKKIENYFNDINKKYENSYHMLLAGFFYALDGYYTTKSNVEAGYGRADILLIPKDKNKTVYILELKMAYSSNLEKKAEEALKQIDDKNYYVEL